MSRRYVSVALAVCCLSPYAYVLAQQQAQQEPKCEEIYKNIKVFNGVPASDLIPAMEFMCASIKWECKDCHDPKDYSAETHAKETTRQMVLLQRDINEKWFNGRLEVTCMSCHNGEEHPVGTPLPTGVRTRYDRLTGAPRPAELFTKHVAAVGKALAMLTLTGTLTAPSDETGEIETKPLELIQAQGGRFRIVSGSRTIVCDGTQVIYGGVLLWGEPVAFFQRMGRTWWDEAAFAGLQGNAIAGKDKLGDKETVVVRGQRGSTGSSEDLHFDRAGGLLLRMVNMKRSSIGTVVTAFDYGDYKAVDGANVPMSVTIAFAEGTTWEMRFDGAKTSPTVDESLFKID